MMNWIKKLFLLFLIGIISQNISALGITYSDSIEISLLTCSPGKQVWAHYGHTAIRYNDIENGNDLAINYGLFSQDQPYFILRFIFGLTDYKVGIQPMEDFMFQYMYEERSVKEQKLNLSKAEKYAIYKILQENLKPENIEYRYNFIYDNCTTRAYHALIKGLKGSLKGTENISQNRETYRDMLHEWNESYPWDQFGEDLLLGIDADKKIEKDTDRLFLPEVLFQYFKGLKYNNQPLVAQTNWLYQAPNTESTLSSGLTPLHAALLFALIASIIHVIEWRKKKIIWLWDAFLMLASGVAGVLFLMMVFSQHPFVNLNVVFLYLNPLPLFFMLRAIRRTRKNIKDNWWKWWGILILIGNIGALFQYIPPAFLIMALFLFINCVIHILLQGQNK